MTTHAPPSKTLNPNALNTVNTPSLKLKPNPELLNPKPLSES